MDEWRYDRAQDFGLPLSARLESVRREGGLASSMLRHAWWLGACTYTRFWHRLRVENRCALPARPPFVLIANHSSHLDTLVMAAALPMRLRQCTFPIAAHDTFFETTLRRSFSSMMLNALPMWRRHCGRHAAGDLRARLISGGCSYILFPEGTRTRTGEMGPFRAGLGMLVAGTPVPVVPCRIDGAFAALPPGHRFPKPAKITLKIGPPQTFASAPNDRSGWQNIAKQMHAIIASMQAPPR
ncbi:MAG: 1-acyl-sn-glycerol-3-phosphate acyltransferase [Phycisphaerales bacterium]|nr:1-acyl-sn-glycerol-3-phosphate acyltransferase [Phycisphaerales bacterium]